MVFVGLLDLVMFLPVLASAIVFFVDVCIHNYNIINLKITDTICRVVWRHEEYSGNFERRVCLNTLTIGCCYVEEL